jgi:hypothetical protein
VHGSRDLSSYIKARRGPSGSYLHNRIQPRIHQTLKILPPGEINMTQPIGCSIVIDFTHNQDQTSRSKGFTPSRAPNLGKSRSLLAWYPMSRANLLNSVNRKSLMVGIAEEAPRRPPCVRVYGQGNLLSESIMIKLVGFIFPILPSSDPLILTITIKLYVLDKVLHLLVFCVCLAGEW